MPDFVVEEATRLDRFLTRRGVQAWRQPILLASGGVRVFRGGSALTVGGLTERLQELDVVRIVEPPPAATVSALQAAVDARARDYAFVPGTTGFDLRMAEVIDLRPQTIRVKDPLVDSLASFVRALGTNALVTEPVRHLLIVSHANPEGLLFVRLQAGAAGHVTYEDLEAAVAARTLNVDPALLQPRPHDAAGVPQPAKVLIRGCRIGTAPAYLLKLKEALGNELPVVAPRHFHVAAIHARPAGRVEYMAYGFVVTRPQRLKDKAAVIHAFQTAALPRIDGSTVAPESWAGWMPANPHKEGEQVVKARVILPTTNRADVLPGRFRFRIRQLFEAEQSFALASDPGTEVGRKAAVQAELERLPRYQGRHPFPEFVRFGYRTMADFMDGWQWRFRYDGTTRTMFFSASRAEYTVIRPIVDPGSNRLFLNFYPQQASVAAIEQLDPADNRFFATV